MTWTVAAFYRFLPLEDLPALRAEAQGFCRERGILGTILLAPEGVNGTVAGSAEAISALVDYLADRFGMVREGVKYSCCREKPFLKLKVRPKKEIITLRAPEAVPSTRQGEFVAAEDWNDLLADPDVLLLDTRNTYETEAGVFAGALDPRLETFTQFKDFAAKALDPARHKKIAMYCTGGIRCEKASSYLLAHGFENVYQLEGGILKYLETVPPEQSLWRGNCFVFDSRRAVDHDLNEAG